MTVALGDWRCSVTAKRVGTALAVVVVVGWIHAVAARPAGQPPAPADEAGLQSPVAQALIKRIAELETANTAKFWEIYRLQKENAALRRQLGVEPSAPAEAEVYQTYLPLVSAEGDGHDR